MKGDMLDPAGGLVRLVTRHRSACIRLAGEICGSHLFVSEHS